MHWPQEVRLGPPPVIPKFAEDERTRPPRPPHDDGRREHVVGIHGAHFGPESRSVLPPPTRTANFRGRIPRHRKGRDLSYLADDASGGCRDPSPGLRDAVCRLPQSPHAHFDLPDHAIDKAMALGQLTATLPYLKKKGVELSEGRLCQHDEAARPSRRVRGLLPGDLPRGGRQRGRTSPRPRMLVNIYYMNLFRTCGSAGATSEQPRPLRVPRLLPLPRRQTQDGRRKDHHAGLRRLPRGRGRGGELSGSPQDPGPRRENPGSPETSAR